MSELLFHCPKCRHLGPPVFAKNGASQCAACGHTLSFKSINYQANSPTTHPPQGQSSNSSRSHRRRHHHGHHTAVHQEDVAEANMANFVIILALVLMTVVGAGFAGYMWTENLKFRKTQASRQAHDQRIQQLKGDLPYIDIPTESEIGKKLERGLVNILIAYYSATTDAEKLRYIYQSEDYALEVDRFYLRNSDPAPIDEIRIEGIYQTRVLERPRYLVKASFSAQPREFVFIRDDDSTRLDWPHLICLGHEVWRDFLRLDHAATREFRLFGWLLEPSSNDSDGPEQLLLRLAAPTSPGSLNLAEDSPIIRVPIDSPQGQKLVKIFKEIPEQYREAALPQSILPNDKFRKLTVKLTTQGQVNQHPSLEIAEVIAGDWLTLEPGEREITRQAVLKQRIQP